MRLGTLHFYCFKSDTRRAFERCFAAGEGSESGGRIGAVAPGSPSHESMRLTLDRCLSNGKGV